MKVITTILILLCAVTVNAATLLDADWATSTGCSCAAAQDGIWTVCTQTEDECSFGVYSGGYGGRNQLRFIVASVTNHLRASSPSMGGPSTAYVRFWFKKNGNCGSMHPMYISSGTSVDSGFGFFRDATNSFSIIPNVYLSDPEGDYFTYNGTISTGTWYRLEYKIERGSGTNGSITVRLNGNDITSNMIGSTSGSLSSVNGTLELQAINYVNFEIYSGQCTNSDWLDISGLLITDGSDWIGGDTVIGTNGLKGGKIFGGKIIQ